MADLCLGIDTAGPVVGVCLWERGADAPVLSRSARLVRGADAWLGPEIAEMLSYADDPSGPSGGSGIQRVAVSTGPGAFTGLRVGVSLALGISVARSVPIVGMSSLMVRAATGRAGMVLSLLDARKGRVYGGFFDNSGPLPRLVGQERDVDLAVLLEGRDDVVATGEGAEVYRVEIERHGGVVSSVATESPAPAVARLAWLRENCGAAEALELRYIRPPDAKKAAPKGG